MSACQIQLDLHTDHDSVSDKAGPHIDHVSVSDTAGPHIDHVSVSDTAGPEDHQRCKQSCFRSSLKEE